MGCPTFVSRQTRLLIPCRSHDEVLSKMWSADSELAHGFDVRADSLEPKNGSLIKGVFIGGERSAFWWARRAEVQPQRHRFTEV